MLRDVALETSDRRALPPCDENDCRQRSPAALLRKCSANTIPRVCEGKLESWQRRDTFAQKTGVATRCGILVCGSCTMKTRTV